MPTPDLAECNAYPEKTCTYVRGAFVIKYACAVVTHERHVVTYLSTSKRKRNKIIPNAGVRVQWREQDSEIHTTLANQTILRNFERTVKFLGNNTDFPSSIRNALRLSDRKSVNLETLYAMIVITIKPVSLQLLLN